MQAKTVVKQEPVSSPQKGRKKKVEEVEEVWKWYVWQFCLFSHAAAVIFSRCKQTNKQVNKPVGIGAFFKNFCT